MYCTKTYCIVRQCTGLYCAALNCTVLHLKKLWYISGVVGARRMTLTMTGAAGNYPKNSSSGPSVTCVMMGLLLLCIIQYISNDNTREFPTRVVGSRVVTHSVLQRYISRPANRANHPHINQGWLCKGGQGHKDGWWHQKQHWLGSGRHAICHKLYTDKISE